MGEQENTTKIAVTSVAQFLETCAQSLSDIAKTGLGPAGQVHLNSIGSMLKQCSQSLRSYSAAYREPQAEEFEHTDVVTQNEHSFALDDDGFLREDQEMRLAKWFEQFGEGDGQVDENPVATAMPKRAVVPGESG